MDKGIIYLIQPAELVGTNRYKIGCSKNNNLNRCKNGYKNGSRYLAIMECFEPLTLEKKIINEFKNNFKLIAGNEFFEGNEDEIFILFIQLTCQHKKKYINTDINTDINLEEKDIVKTFFNEKYEYSENKKDFIQLKDMYEGYKRYCLLKKIKADKLKIFKNRIIGISSNFKERYVYIDESSVKRDINSVLIHMKAIVKNRENSID